MTAPAPSSSNLDITAPTVGSSPTIFAPVEAAPRLTQAQVGMLREIEVQDEYGQRRCIHIPAERPLTVFVDKRLERNEIERAIG